MVAVVIVPLVRFAVFIERQEVGRYPVRTAVSGAVAVLAKLGSYGSA
jgi:hypothetical protein